VVGGIPHAKTLPHGCGQAAVIEAGGSVATREPRWVPQDRLRQAALPGVARSLLFDQGSLTRRVQLACGPGFRVRLRIERWERPLPSERRLLRMAPSQLAWVREVELLCGPHPWVYARTVIPATSLRRAVLQLVNLGERPLGAVLFARREARRGPVEMACLLPAHRLHGSASANLGGAADELWARRTLFHFAGKPLLVNEVFLPGLLAAGYEPSG